MTVVALDARDGTAGDLAPWAGNGGRDRIAFLERAA